THALSCSNALAISSASNKTWIPSSTRSGGTLLSEARWPGNDQKYSQTALMSTYYFLRANIARIRS
ncbi:MAG TPA: hypothetical protein VKY57_09280, partial [Chitinispirillaceae bacterium]|nr:hypothetical protein [Chitinispirillaceae bacterium]